MALIDKVSPEDRAVIDKVVKNANMMRRAINMSRMNESKRNMELEELQQNTRRKLVKILMKYPLDEK